jgi:hypothetical protein
MKDVHHRSVDTCAGAGAGAGAMLVLLLLLVLWCYGAMLVL